MKIRYQVKFFSVLPFVYTGLIFISLPFLPKLWKYMEAENSRLTVAIPEIVFIFVLFSILFYLIAVKNDVQFWKYVLFVLLCLGVFHVIYNMRLSIEKVHILEYALLTVVIVNSLKKRMGYKFVYFFALIFSMVIGVMDEGIQYFLPNRVFDKYDIALNWKGAALGFIMSIILFCGSRIYKDV